MRASDGCELDLVDRGLLEGGEGVDAEDLGVVGAFGVEVAGAAEVEGGVLGEECGDGGGEGGAGAGGGNGGGGHGWMKYYVENTLWSGFQLLKRH